MPARGAWRDAGVTAIGIEEPFSRATMGGQVPLLITLGAIVATLPPTCRSRCSAPTTGGKRAASRSAASATS
jgi:hypothetical protein